MFGSGRVNITLHSDSCERAHAVPSYHTNVQLLAHPSLLLLPKKNYPSLLRKSPFTFITAARRTTHIYYKFGYAHIALTITAWSRHVIPEYELGARPPELTVGHTHIHHLSGLLIGSNQGGTSGSWYVRTVRHISPLDPTTS